VNLDGETNLKTRRPALNVRLPAPPHDHGAHTPRMLRGVGSSGSEHTTPAAVPACLPGPPQGQRLGVPPQICRQRTATGSSVHTSSADHTSCAEDAGSAGHTYSTEHTRSAQQGCTKAAPEGGVRAHAGRMVGVPMEMQDSGAAAAPGGGGAAASVASAAAGVHEWAEEGGGGAGVGKPAEGRHRHTAKQAEGETPGGASAAAAAAAVPEVTAFQTQHQDEQLGHAISKVRLGHAISKVRLGHAISKRCGCTESGT